MILAARSPSSVQMACSSKGHDATPLTTSGMRAGYATQPKPRKPELKRCGAWPRQVVLGKLATATT